MRKLNLVIIATGFWAAGSLAAAAEAHADHDHMALMRETKDRIAIEHLMWSYVRALDTLDADGYAATYAEDGQFGAGPKAEKGRAALRDMIAGLRKSRADREAKGEATPGTLHAILNHNILFQDADHATFESYWTTLFMASGATAPARVGAVGWDHNELVRVNGQWLIQLRNVAP